MPRPTSIPIHVPNPPVTPDTRLNEYLGRVVKSIREIRDSGRRERTIHPAVAPYRHPFKISVDLSTFKGAVAAGGVYAGYLFENGDTTPLPIPAMEYLGEASTSNETVAASTTYGVWYRYVAGLDNIDSLTSPATDLDTIRCPEASFGDIIFDSTNNASTSLSTLIGAETGSSSYSYTWIGQVSRDGANNVTVTQALRSDIFLPLFSYSDDVA